MAEHDIDPDVLLADRGYDSGTPPAKAALREHGTVARLRS